MQLERRKFTGSGSLPGSHPYPGRNPSENERIELYGISEGKEQFDNLRKMGEHEIQISKSSVLVQRILCRYGRQE